MNRPLEHNYTSLTAYTRALESYCDTLEHAALAIEHELWPTQKNMYQADYNNGVKALAQKIRNLKGC